MWPKTRINIDYLDNISYLTNRVHSAIIKDRKIENLKGEFMKKSFVSFILIAVLASLLFMTSTQVEARGLKLGKDTGKVLGGIVVGVILNRAQERERIRRREREERSRIRIEEERNASRIRQEVAKREELKRREALRDLQFQQELELERERQERERQERKQLQNPQPAPSGDIATFHKDGTVSFRGIKFSSVKDFAKFIDEAKK